jgi:hypothetical protein
VITIIPDTLAPNSQPAPLGDIDQLSTCKYQSKGVTSAAVDDRRIVYCNNSQSKSIKQISRAGAQYVLKVEQHFF